MVCPKGCFLAKLKYHFSVPGSDSDDRPPAFAANPFNENLPQPLRVGPRGGQVPPGGGPQFPPNRQGMLPNMQGMPPNMQGMPPRYQGPGQGEKPPWRGNVPTGKNADRAAQTDAYVHRDLKGVKVGRKLLQFNPQGDDLYVDRMDQGKGQGQYQGQGDPWLGGGQNDPFRGMGGGQQQPPPNQGFPPYGMGGDGPTPPPIKGTPIEKPIDGANLLTLHDAFDLWIYNENTNRENELHKQALKDHEEALRQSVDDPHLREVLVENQPVGVRYNLTHYLNQHGPCPTLLHCVGYQACLFRFSNEFCRKDPYPGKMCYFYLEFTFFNLFSWTKAHMVEPLQSRSQLPPEDSRS